MMRHLSTLAELVGLLLVIAAAFLTDFELGLAVAGAVLVLLGFLLDRPASPGADE